MEYWRVGMREQGEHTSTALSNRKAGEAEQEELLINVHSLLPIPYSFMTYARVTE